jgi:Ca2+-binding EF-hand superfamily protein
MHGMTNLEIMEAFTMADINKDGALSKDEYKAFHQFFVSKFNSCATEDYMIDVAQMEGCVFNDISVKSIAYKGMMNRTFEGFGNHEGESATDENSKAFQVVLGCDRDLDGKINLAEYLMMRRALIAWNECAQETMNRAGLRCALNITTTDHRNVDQAEADTAFGIGISMQNYKNGLSFPVFLMIADL